jgi:hypothetical protein
MKVGLSPSLCTIGRISRPGPPRRDAEGGEEIAGLDTLKPKRRATTSANVVWKMAKANQ